MALNPKEEYDGDTCTLTYAKGEETYVFRFTSDYRAEILRRLGRFASNDELNFNWYDAANVSQRIGPDSPSSIEDILGGRAAATPSKG